MPELCRFDGMIVRMYKEPDSKHKLPHIHVDYQDDDAVLSLDGVILEGDLPSKKMRLLLVWMERRRDMLYENWRLLVNNSAHFKIEPLR